MSQKSLQMIEDYILKINLSNDNFNVLIEEETFNRLVKRLESEEKYEECKKLISNKEKMIFKRK